MMGSINHDNLPSLVDAGFQRMLLFWSTFRTRLALRWWGVEFAPACSFYGYPRFHRFPASRISVGACCRFRSSIGSNMIGINHPCMISTLKKGAEILIGPECGFSGTVIACAKRIVIGENVRCGANTVITDTDWHAEDLRSKPDAPVCIERNVWLGSNVMVLKGVHIGENTLVAAGSVVTRSLPPDVIAGGIPARVLRKLDNTEREK